MRYIKRYIKWVSAAAAAVLIISAAGCAAEQSVETAAQAPSASELPLPEEYTQEGKITELTTTMMRNPETLHPIYVTDEDTLNIMSLICEPAIALDYSDRPKPSVIESWTLDEAGTTVIFNVRKGVAFHDGSGEVKAEDIAYCLDLIMAASEQECIYAKYKSIVSSYEAIDDYKLQLRLSMKTGDVYYLMNFPVIPKTVYSSRPADTKSVPVGTGPYHVDKYSPEAGMELTVNENWWRTAPSITRITASAVDDNESKLAGYQMGTYNFVAMTAMAANSYRSQKNTFAYKTTTLYYEGLVPNMSNRFLQDVNIRKAISLALDRREIIATGVLGGGIVTTTPIRGDLWYLEGTSGSLIEYNTAQANALLDDAGYFMDIATRNRYVENADGSKGYINIELIYCEYDELYYRNAVASMVETDLAEIGVRVTVKELDKQSFEEALGSGDFDIALASFYTKANSDISYLFGYNSTCNYGGYADEELQSLIAASRLALTEEEQQTAFIALNNMLSERLPHIGLYFREYMVYASSAIKNIKNLRRGAVFADINAWS